MPFWDQRKRLTLSFNDLTLKPPDYQNCFKKDKRKKRVPNERKKNQRKIGGIMKQR